MRVFLAAFILPALALNASAEPYIEGGFLNNPDAYGDVSNSVGRVAIGYIINANEIYSGLSGNLAIDIQARHESDTKHNGEADLISNESYGLILRYTFRK